MVDSTDFDLDDLCESIRGEGSIQVDRDHSLVECPASDKLVVCGLYSLAGSEKRCSGPVVFCEEDDEDSYDRFADCPYKP